jgi:hypothetical protein
VVYAADANEYRGVTAMSDRPDDPTARNDAEEVDRTWNPGGVGNQVGDERETSDATWNPGGVGNATEDGIRTDLESPDAAESAGE